MPPSLAGAKRLAPYLLARSEPSPLLPASHRERCSWLGVARGLAAAGPELLSWRRKAGLSLCSRAGDAAHPAGATGACPARCRFEGQREPHRDEGPSCPAPHTEARLPQTDLEHDPVLFICHPPLPRLPRRSVCFCLLTRTSRSRPGLFPWVILFLFFPATRFPTLVESEVRLIPKSWRCQRGQAHGYPSPLLASPRGIKDAEQLLHPWRATAGGTEGPLRDSHRAVRGQEMPVASGRGAAGVGPGSE